MCIRDRIIVGKGHWRKHTSSTMILPCPSPDSCLGGLFSDCAEGYTGNLCSQCLETPREVYRRNASGSCTKCPTVWESLGLMISFVAAVLLQIWYYRRSSHKASLHLDNTEDERSTSVLERIFANHMTTILILAKASMDMPQVLSYMDTILSQVGNLSLLLSPVECLLPRTSFPVYYGRLIYFTIYPAVIFIGATVLWLLLRKRRRWNKDYLFATFIIIAFFLQPGLNKAFWGSTMQKMQESIRG
eukprot:TRINITY_DN7825_c0_g1_i3.p1 TRINITY_DN7825_c0_g1~~TRINITY_DN7825_c0_g1_i3.p1  ORF type:complete len:245 (+),score=1.96 TRINITY_DN7825_c0_g1_i3:64-798(+)